MVRHQLLEYSSAGLSNLLLFMQVPGRPETQRRYYSLSPELTLDNQLAGKSFIEYPTVIVALPSEADNYTVFDPSEPVPESKYRDVEPDSFEHTY